MNIEYATELNHYRKEHCGSEKQNSTMEGSIEQPVLNLISPIVTEEKKEISAPVKKLRKA